MNPALNSELPHFILISPSPRAAEVTPVRGESLVEAWTRAITALPSKLQTHFTVLQGTLAGLPADQLRCDCVVSPANSFGIMGGGYDLALSLAFQGAKGTQTLSHYVQRALRTRWNGYLPPGSCLITELPTDLEGGGGNQFGASSIAVLPTMRYPVDVRWHQDLVYNAVWSLLVEISQWNAEHLAPGPGDARRKMIKRVLMTGLGTGYGKVSAARCAQQMILAIRHFTQGVPDEANWDNVSSLIQEVNITLEL